MNALGIRLNDLLRGRVALGVALVAAASAVGLVVSRLGWSHWPNVVTVVTSVWLYLLIIWFIATSAIQSVIRRKAVFTEMLWCLGLGLAWDRIVRFIPFPIPFDVGHGLLVYGLTGLAAACLRRAQVRTLFGSEVRTPPPTSDTGKTKAIS